MWPSLLEHSFRCRLGYAEVYRESFSLETHIQHRHGGLWGLKFDPSLECAPDGGQFVGWELTGAAGLSEDESHGQAPHP